MLRAEPELAGFRGLQRRLLLALKKAQPLTVKELAAQFKVTGNALRRHLRTLEGAGVVRYRREVRGVGGPTFAYSLTDQGEALFPRAYGGVLAEALELVRAEHGVDGVVGLFRKQWAGLSEQIAPALRAGPLPERAARLAELRTGQGYMAEVVSAGATEAVLREHNCAIRDVAARFPEVCAAEASYFAELLGADVERRAHILTGCNCCEYHVRAPGAEHSETRPVGQTISGE